MSMSALKSYKERQAREYEQQQTAEYFEKLRKMCDVYIDGYLEQCELQFYDMLADELGFRKKRLERAMRGWHKRHMADKARYIRDEDDWGFDPNTPYKDSTHTIGLKNRLRDAYGFDYDAMVEEIMKGLEENECDQSENPAEA